MRDARVPRRARNQDESTHPEPFRKAYGWVCLDSENQNVNGDAWTLSRELDRIQTEPELPATKIKRSLLAQARE